MSEYRDIRRDIWFGELPRNAGEIWMRIFNEERNKNR